MADSKLVGSINLARLENVGIMNVKGKTATKKCLVIPIEENDIYVKVEEKTSTQTGEVYISKMYNLGIEIYERREADQYGNVCYAKLSASKEWIGKHTQDELKARNDVFLGQFKSVAIPSGNQAQTMDAPYTEASSDDDLPF
jgi:hypothetical protein